MTATTNKMTGHKGAKGGHQAKLEKYGGDTSALRAAINGTPLQGDPLKLHNIMKAIQGVLTSLEARIDSGTTEVTLVSADLCNMGAKMRRRKTPRPPLTETRWR
ncbi:hypothetical protein NDU88_004016 [Pleurodeles waltl]|uniref:Uncharacterized protein n=1 Tax=Pleurodeles waltl TaxID=8319 RepID=A0AAV7SHK0_PLEWA|nr:hypothetical protein NDU88_004016 [Pleurodeles waltl]